MRSRSRSVWATTNPDQHLSTGPRGSSLSPLDFCNQSGRTWLVGAIFQKASHTQPFRRQFRPEDARAMKKMCLSMFHSFTFYWTSVAVICFSTFLASSFVLSSSSSPELCSSSAFQPPCSRRIVVSKSMIGLTEVTPCATSPAEHKRC